MNPGTHLPAITPGALFTRWQLDPVMAALAAVLAGAYLAGVFRLRRSGQPWPVRRTVVFLFAGLGGLAVFTMSGLAVYDRVLFWATAVQYTLLLAVVPVLLAMGDPIGLAMSALPAPAAARLRRVLRGPVVQLLTFPLASAVLAVVTQFALYLTPYFVTSLRSTAVHELVYVQLVVTGCLFTLPILGAEVLPDWRICRLTGGALSSLGSG